LTTMVARQHLMLRLHVQCLYRQNFIYIGW